MGLDNSTPLVKCLQILLTVFNLVLLISGIAILAIGIWVKLKIYIYMELTTVYYAEAPYGFMVVGAGIILIAVMGCCCTLKAHGRLLYIFSFFLVVIFIAELGLAIASFVYKGKIQSGFKNGMDRGMDAYATDKNKAMAVNNVQSLLHCCGDANYTEWFNKKWQGNSTPDNSVPKSCCIKEAASCKNSALPNNLTNSTEIYTQSNFLIIAAVAISFSFLQLLGALLTCSLAKQINKLRYDDI